MSNNDYNLSIQKPMPEGATKVFEGNIFTAWQWQQKLYDGSFATYERLTRNDVTHVVGVLPNGKILLTEDTQPQRKAVITPPGGKVEPGESPAEAVKRECLEETGYEIGELIPWHHYRPPMDKMDYVCHAFIGRGLTEKGPASPEGGEKIRILQFTFDEFLELGTNPKMRDLVIRIILLEAQLDPKKKANLRKLLYG